MVESESTALPLGDTPTIFSLFHPISPVKLHDIHRITVNALNWLGYEDSNLGMVESESTALPLGDTPTNFFPAPPA